MEDKSDLKKRLNQMRLGQRCWVQQMGQWRILRDEVHYGGRADCNRVRGGWQLGERALIADFLVEGWQRRPIQSGDGSLGSGKKLFLFFLA